jgi:hypothetical protein
MMKMIRMTMMMTMRIYVTKKQSRKEKKKERKKGGSEINLLDLNRNSQR